MRIYNTFKGDKVMKAAVFYGKNDLKIEDIPKPRAKKGEVLVKVHACGICGTDAHIFCGDEGAAKTPAGTVLGHEFAGEIVEIGDGVSGFSIGEKVSVDPNKLCGGCEYCKRGIGHFCTDMTGIGTTVNGGFAEYCAVPATQAQKVMPSVSFEQAAMSEPVSCCLHGIELCNIKCGDTAAVIGCGMIGLIMVQLLKLSGAAKIIAIEPIEQKRKQALSLGADIALAPDEVEKALKNISQIDCVIECAGRTDTIEQAIRIAGKNSVVMMFGLTAPQAEIKVKPFEIFKKEITLRSSFINPYTFPAAVKLIESGKLDVSSIVYEKAPLEELPKILADSRRRSLGKYIITF